MKEIAGRSAVALFMRVIGACAGLVMTVAVSRFLGQQDAGQFFLALAVANFLALASCVGMDSAILRFTGMYSAENNWPAVNASLMLALKVVGISGALVGGGIFAFSEPFSQWMFNDATLGPTMAAFALAVPALAASTIMASAFLGIGRVGVSVFVTLIGAQLCVAAGIYFVESSADAAWIYSFSAFVLFGLSAVWWKRTVPSPIADSDEVKAIYKICMPLWGVTLMANLAQWGGVFVAGAMLPPSDVAIMAIANRVTLIVSFILIATNMVVAPKFAALFRQGKLDELRRLAQQSLRLVFLVSAPIFAVLLLWPDFVMGIFGAQYIKGSLILQILLIGQLVNALTGSVNLLLNMSGHERDSRNIAFISTPLMLISAVALTSQYGLQGTALAFSLGLVFQNVACAYVVRKRLGFWTVKIWEQ